jgi:tRNA(Ile)-lysidine synthase
MKNTIEIVRIVRDTVQERRMFKRGDRVLVALSGGPDSMALLYLLRELQKTFDLKISVAHLNHQLRGKASGREEAFVRRTAKKLKIPCTIGSRNIRQIAKQRKLSIEEAARNERYDFLASAARRAGAAKIAVAHTADDQAETVLFRLIRGATGGIAGIPATRPLDTHLTVVRPLLNLWKKDIAHYLHTKNIPFTIDRSNYDTDYVRNRIRHKLLPFLLKDFNPNIKEVLLHNAENLSEIKDLARWEMKKVFTNLVKVRDKNTIELDKVHFEILHPAIRKEVICECLRLLKGDLSSIYYNNIADILTIALSKQSGKAISLPDTITVGREFNKILFRKGTGGSPRPPFREDIAVPGTTVLNTSGIEIRTDLLAGKALAPTSRKQKKPFYLLHQYDRPLIELFDLDKVALPLSVRSRKEGDRYRPIGMSGEKKIKEILIEEKVPLSERPQIPLVVDAAGSVIWLVGYRIGDKAKVGPQTKKLLKITIEKQQAPRPQNIF